MYSRRKQRCKCQKTKQDPNISIVYAPKNFTAIANNDDEMQYRVWSYMKPPKISEPTPMINPERLEIVRSLLENSTDYNIQETHIDSEFNLEMLDDESVVTTKKRTEMKIYPRLETFEYLGPQKNNDENESVLD